MNQPCRLTVKARVEKKRLARVQHEKRQQRKNWPGRHTWWSFLGRTDNGRYAAGYENELVDGKLVRLEDDVLD